MVSLMHMSNVTARKETVQMLLRCEVAQHAGPPKMRSCWTRNYSQQLRASCAFSAVKSYVKATRAICAQVVVTFVKHIGIQSACGPNSVKTNPTSTSPPEPYAPHVAKANGERWMSGVSELVRVCELKVRVCELKVSMAPLR